jgi:hypothetical protein
MLRVQRRFERRVPARRLPEPPQRAVVRDGRPAPELDLDPDEQLAADLTSPTYKLDSRGRRVVEPKQETKKRLGRSPDRGDMALLTLVPAGADVVSESTRNAPAPAVAADWASEGMNPATERW